MPILLIDFKKVFDLINSIFLLNEIGLMGILEKKLNFIKSHKTVSRSLVLTEVKSLMT